MSHPSAPDHLAPLLEEARALARSRPEAAEPLYREVLQQAPDTLEALSFVGTAAARHGNLDEAIGVWVRCIGLEPGNPEFLFTLATALEQRGDAVQALAAYLGACRRNPREARFALFAGAALDACGRHADAAMLFSLADGNDPALLPGRDNPRLHPEVRRRCVIANRVLRGHFAALHREAVDEAEHETARSSGAAVDVSRIRNAIWVQTHPESFSFRTPLQKPGIFYVPDLAPLPVAPRERLPWAAHIEAATSVIRAEYLAAMQAGAQLSPYVEADVRNPLWQALRGRLDWSSLHLFRSAQEQPVAAMFPRTLQALAAADMFRVGHTTPMEVFFSRLAPGTHIPPHFGVANQRLTVHLPLIVPQDCSIRVGEQFHTWREGEIFAFDDSFEHEAWNRGDAERVVLIFETHHPDLRPEERLAIEHSYAMRGRWLRERHIPAA